MKVEEGLFGVAFCDCGHGRGIARGGLGGAQASGGRGGAFGLGCFAGGATSQGGEARTRLERPAMSVWRPKAVPIARAEKSSAGAARTGFCGFAARVAGAPSTR